MLNAFREFNAGVSRMAIGWRIWMGCLVTVNFIIPWFILYRTEAQLTIAAGILGMFIALILVKLQGFTRLVGLMHFFWIPLVIYFWILLPEIPANDFLGIWIRSVICLNSISLVIDTVDVFRYIAGDRAAL